jgi:hypothetical protein
MLRAFAYTSYFLILIGCAHASKPPLSTQSLEVHEELLDDFLGAVCNQRTEAAFIEAWDQHEKRNWGFYSAVYYRNESDLFERASLKSGMKDRQKEMCKNARAFRFVAKTVVTKAAQDAADLTGVAPRTPIFFAAALQQTDGNGAEFKGRKIYVLNGRHDTYARTPGMIATITHELIHGSFSERFLDGHTGLNPIQNGLYWEGAAVFAVATLYPEIGDGAIGIDKEDLKLAEKFEKCLAREVLSHWDKGKVSQETRDRFFSGRKPTDGMPRKMGYYFGLRIFQKLAQQRGAQGALSVGPGLFEQEVRKYLETLARD